MELAIVIPVYNEEKTIKNLIQDLNNLVITGNISCQFIIINDGSTDNSLSVLRLLESDIQNFKILSGKNSGHGPSILKGYLLSLEHEWVFQIDSDYDYALSAFTVLWNNRKKADLLIAEREKRNASFLRNFATAITHYVIVVVYGKGIKDINSPYRLIRTQKLSLALSYIGSNSFAPNVLIVAYFLKNRFATFCTFARLNIKPNNRKSKMSFYMLMGCFKTFTDLLLFRFKI